MKVTVSILRSCVFLECNAWLQVLGACPWLQGDYWPGGGFSLVCVDGEVARGREYTGTVRPKPSGLSVVDRTFPSENGHAKVRRKGNSYQAARPGGGHHTEGGTATDQGSMCADYYSRASINVPLMVNGVKQVTTSFRVPRGSPLCSFHMCRLSMILSPKQIQKLGIEWPLCAQWPRPTL